MVSKTGNKQSLGFVKGILKNKQFVIIFIIAFFIYSSSQMLTTTLPKYANELGATSQAIGLLSGIYAMAALLMRPFSGQLVDNEKRLVLLRIVLFVILVSVLGLTVVHSYWLLVAFRGLNGFAWGVGSTLCMTIATGCFDTANMAFGIGIYGLGQTLAQTIAPSFGLSVSGRFGYNSLYRVNVALILICIFLTLLMKFEDVPKQKKTYTFNLKGMICIPAILPSALTMCNSISRSSITAFLVIFAAKIDVSNIGLFFTFQALTILFVRPLMSRMCDKYGTLKTLIPCEILDVFGLVLVACAHSLPLFLVAAVLFGFASAGEQPILMSECVKSVGPSMRGRASNTSYIGTDIGNFIGSNIAGVLVAYLGFSGMFAIFTLPSIICTICYYFIYKSKQIKRTLNESVS